MTLLVLGVDGASATQPAGAQKLGYMQGSALAAALFPEAKEYAKTSDLKAQNSLFGSTIPIVWGSFRAAGNLICSSPLTGTTDMVASFAVSICEGVKTIGRVWADGRLLLKPGEFNYFTGSQAFYTGSEDQMPDPTLEGMKGAGNVPAHRGLVYAVFTDLQLKTFSNRIPNLTFEVLSAEAPTLASIVTDISTKLKLLPEEINVADIATPIDGFSITKSMSGREAIDPLLSAFFCDAVESDGAVKFVRRGNPPQILISYKDILPGQ